MTTADIVKKIDLADVDVTQLLGARLFAGEDIATLKQVLETCQIMAIEKDHVLFEPGQANTSLFVVLSGRLGVKLSGDSEEVLDYVGAGSCVGEMSVLEGLPVSAYVYASETSRLLVIGHAVIWSLINNSKVVARNMLLLLSARIRSGNRNIGESLEAKRLVEHDSKIDALTGLYNRGWLNEALPRWTKRKSTLSLMILDIDHFKKYNDTHGHLGGDVAIKCVAITLMQTLRPIDFAARYGGEEFVVILPEASINEAHDIAERVRLAIKSKDIDDHECQNLPRVTVSVGVAELQQGMTCTELLSTADSALYRAKHGGRDQVSL